MFAATYFFPKKPSSNIIRSRNWCVLSLIKHATCPRCTLEKFTFTWKILENKTVCNAPLYIANTKKTDFFLIVGAALFSILGLAFKYLPSRWTIPVRLWGPNLRIQVPFLDHQRVCALHSSFSFPETNPGHITDVTYVGRILSSFFFFFWKMAKFLSCYGTRWETRRKTKVLFFNRWNSSTA